MTLNAENANNNEVIFIGLLFEKVVARILKWFCFLEVILSPIKTL